LILYDVQKACLGGLNEELIYSARLDNLMMTYCAVQGLIQSTSSSGKPLDDETTIRLIAGFDHEEIGSSSAQGADSNMLPSVLRRLSCLPSSGEAESDSSYDRASSDTADTSTAFEQTLSSSFLVSADMAHSVNPNYSGKYEAEHKPLMNKGTVLKINANVRYATNSPGIVIMQELAKRAKKNSADKRSGSTGVPLQLFVVKNDSPCGSTIGCVSSPRYATFVLTHLQPDAIVQHGRQDARPRKCTVGDAQHSRNRRRIRRRECDQPFRVILRALRGARG